MARDIFGNQRKLRKEKDYRYKTSEWDITKEKLKMGWWVVLFGVWTYFIIQPQNW